MPIEDLCKIRHFIYKINNFSINDSTCTGRTAKFFFPCCWKIIKMNKINHKKKAKTKTKTKIRTKHM